MITDVNVWDQRSR